MQPLPPTVEAFEKHDRVGLPDAAAVLQRLGRRALAEVPECVGLSLTLVEDGITLTLVSSSLDVAQIDAMQYLDGGPCVAPVGDARTVQTHDLGLLDEDRWSLFSRSSAAAGVQRSSFRTDDRYWRRPARSSGTSAAGMPTSSAATAISVT